MSKSFIPEVAQLLGLEINEEFKIGGDDWTLFCITECGLMERPIKSAKNSWTASQKAPTLEGLLAGRLKIIKLPWKPKSGEEYWTFGQYDKRQ